ncbi:MAG: helix-turn-helix domain-containing protein [Syntrophorhabdaceae bacterium]|nr:helix-turn-helix domain-containing protein [Syntrophorhabdaceae bacterium]
MNGRRIVESMEEAVAIAKGVLPPDSYTVNIPAVVDVKTIRNNLGLSQASFSARFGLSLHTLRNWEQGKRTPDPAARAYLKVIEKAPDVVIKALSG